MICDELIKLNRTPLKPIVSKVYNSLSIQTALSQRVWKLWFKLCYEELLGKSKLHSSPQALILIDDTSPTTTLLHFTDYISLATVSSRPSLNTRLTKARIVENEEKIMKLRNNKLFRRQIPSLYLSPSLYFSLNALRVAQHSTSVSFCSSKYPDRQYNSV